MTPTPDTRANEEGDWIAREIFSSADLRLTPEESVARHAHNWGCFSFDLYHYHDPALGSWVRRVGDLLSTEGEAEKCRERFLSPDELAEGRRRQAEDF